MTRCTIRIQAVLLALAVLPAINAGGQTAAPVADDANMATKLDALTRQMEEQKQAMEAQKQELERLRAQVGTNASGPRPMDQREREELAKMIHEELAKSGALQAKLPTWLDGLAFSGDLRMRYEGQWFDGTTKGKTTPWDRNRGRFRLRFGFSKQIDEEWSAVFRLASGSDNSADSTNQTFTGDFTKKPVWIDLAYVQYKPKWCKDLTAVVGKMTNPFVTTDMIWDPDINPEGAAETFRHKCGDSFEFFATAAQMFLQENANLDDVTLLAYQLGLRYKLTKDVAWTLAAAYYDYINVDQDTQLAGTGKGNSTETVDKNVLFSNHGKQDFQVLDLYTDLTFKLPGACKQVKFFGDVAWNLANDAPSPFENERFAGSVGAVLGQAKKKGDWEVSYAYKFIEANSVVSAFSDSDFGGTDRQGHVFGAKYMLRDNVALGAKMYFVDRIVNPSNDPAVAILQADLEIKF